MSHIASTLKVGNPKKTQLIAAFNSLGYLITQTYYDPKLFKTNAPQKSYKKFSRRGRPMCMEETKRRL